MLFKKNAKKAVVGVDIGSTLIKVLKLSGEGAELCVEGYAVELRCGVIAAQLDVVRDNLLFLLIRQPCSHNTTFLSYKSAPVSRNEARHIYPFLGMLRVWSGFPQACSPLRWIPPTL